MEKALKGNLSGVYLFKRAILPLLLAFLAYIIGIARVVIATQSSMEMSSLIVPVLLLIASIIAITVTLFYFQYIFIKHSVESVEYESNWETNITFGGFTGRLLGGALLTVITLGIYTPWFMKMIMSYIYDNTSYNGKFLKFEGTGLEIFWKILMVYIIPMIIYLILHFTSELFLLQMILLLIMNVGMYTVYLDWGLKLTYGAEKVIFDKSFFEIMKFVAIQVILTCITLGLYVPALWIKMYGFILENLHVENGNSFRFEAKIGEGYFSILGRILLSIITLYIYLPWGYAKTMNWFVDNTTVISNQSQLSYVDEEATEESMK